MLSTYSKPSTTTNLPQALILAAGDSLRFWPLSVRQHKSLFRLGGATLLQHTLDSLIDHGVSEIVIVQSPRSLGPYAEEVELPSDYIAENYKTARVQFIEQPVAAGQGDAIIRSSDLLGESFLVVQPENIQAGHIADELVARSSDDDVAVIAGTKRSDFNLYAVLETAGSKLTRITEKPVVAQSAEPLCNMGVYLFRHEFLKHLRDREPGPRSIIDALTILAELGSASVVESKSAFLPLKYPAHLWAYARHLGLVDQSSSLSDTDLPGQVVQSPSGKYIVSEHCLVGDVQLDNVIMAPKVVIGDGTRSTGVGPSSDFDAVVIGEGATIGSDVLLDPAVKIGFKATIASGAHVAQDVSDHAVVTSLCPTRSLREPSHKRSLFQTLGSGRHLAVG